MITQKELKGLLDYDPKTGVFIWKVSLGKKVKVGDVAGTKSHGYIHIGVNKKIYTAHRLAWFYMEGVWPEEVDHVRHIRADNRWEKLREVTHAENHRNQSKPKNNTSGVVGVYWNKEKGKWEARIRIDGILKHLSYFDDKFEAVCARKSADNKYGFHENHGK